MQERVPVSKERIFEVVNQVHARIEMRLIQKGRGSFISVHETLGHFREEMLEVELAVHSKIEDDVLREFEDVAVNAIFGMASILENRRAQADAAEAARQKREDEARRAMDQKLGISRGG